MHTRLRFHHLLFACVITSLLVACGGGGGGSDDDEDGDNGGWVNVSSDLEPATQRKTLQGEAFVSRDYTHCANLHSQCHPGVTVSWHNRTLDVEGEASSVYEGSTGWKHQWQADVPLAPGENEIVLTARDPGGRYGTRKVRIKGLLQAPQGLTSDSGNRESILTWEKVQGATGYRIYWSNTAGAIYPNGKTIKVSSTGYRHKGLVNGRTYYYVVTALGPTDESAPSKSILELVGVPSKPTNPLATLAGNDIVISWDSGDRADSHTLYWSNSPDVDPATANSIENVSSPHFHTGLSGQPYYYRVVASNVFGDSDPADEVDAFPALPPPAPSNLKLGLRSDSAGGYLPIVYVSWDASGVETEIYKCRQDSHILSAPSLQFCNNHVKTRYGCGSRAIRVGTVSGTGYLDNDILQLRGGSYYVYSYYLVASNPYGQSAPTSTISVCSGRD